MIRAEGLEAGHQLEGLSMLVFLITDFSLLAQKKKEFELFLKQHLTSFVKEWDGEFILFEDNKKIEKKNILANLATMIL